MENCITREFKGHNALIICSVWFLTIVEHSNRTIFVLMVHFSQTFERYMFITSKSPQVLLVLMFIVAIAKIADSQQIIAFNKLFVWHYSIN